VAISEWNGALADPTLHVDRLGLSIGEVSVGLPMACTTDTVLLRYLDLVRLVHRTEVDQFTPPEADVAVLAEATGLSVECVEQRIRSLQA
jgi:hypothetical protein